MTKRPTFKQGNILLNLRRNASLDSFRLAVEQEAANCYNIQMNADGRMTPFPSDKYNEGFHDALRLVRRFWEEKCQRPIHASRGGKA